MLQNGPQLMFRSASGKTFLCTKLGISIKTNIDIILRVNKESIDKP